MSGRNSTYYQNEDFVPNFLSSLNASDAVKAACGDDAFCMFDYVVTENANVANNTLRVQVSADDGVRVTSES